MEHKVINSFVCKESGVFIALGSFYTCEDVKRVKELEKLGFVEANEKLSSLEEPVEEKKTVKRTRKKASEVNAGES